MGPSLKEKKTQSAGRICCYSNSWPLLLSSPPCLEADVWSSLKRLAWYAKMSIGFSNSSMFLAIINYNVYVYVYLYIYTYIYTYVFQCIILSSTHGARQSHWGIPQRACKKPRSTSVDVALTLYLGFQGFFPIGAVTQIEPQARSTKVRWLAALCRFLQFLHHFREVHRPVKIYFEIWLSWTVLHEHHRTHRQDS